MNLKIASAVVCLTLPLSALQGGLAVFRGTPGGSGDVLSADPSATTPTVGVPGLDGITLLALDLAGRLELEQLRPDRARLRNDIPGAARLLLPAGRGSLYRFSRPSATGLDYGLFVIDDTGAARVVFTLPGVGLAGDEPSFAARVAIAPSGTHALVVTALPAGGDVLELDLASGAALNLTAQLPPQRFFASGVHHRGAWGVLVSTAGVWRFASGVAGVSPLSFGGGSPAHFSGEVVFSSNDQWALTTAGDAPDQLHVFAFDSSGPATQVTSAAQAISPAGYLPEHLHGPYMAISEDGSHCAWRVETAVSTEAFLARVPQVAPSPSHQLTQDANFIDTIDEIGDFFFRPLTNVLVFAAGERSTTGLPVLENLDYYSGQLPATGGPSLANLTLTSGVPLPPFVLPAELKPTSTALVPGSPRMLLHTRKSGGTGDLIAADSSSTGFTVVVPEVKDIQFLESAGADVLVGVRRGNGSKPCQVFRVGPSFAPPAAPLLSVNTLHEFDRFAAGAGGWAAFVERTLSKERLWRFEPATGALVKFSDRALFFGPTLAWAPSGELGFSVGQGGLLSIFAAWPRTSAVLRLPTPVAPGFLLPGA